jgi:hypothetical protein
MARERVGFMWASANAVPVTPSGQLTDGPFTPNGGRFPPCIGSGAAPVWGNPRRRAATGRHPRAEREAGTRRKSGGINPRIAAGSTVADYGLRRFRWTPPPSRHRHEENVAAVFTRLLTSKVISTPWFRCGRPQAGPHLETIVMQRHRHP